LPLHLKGALTLDHAHLIQVSHPRVTRPQSCQGPLYFSPVLESPLGHPLVETAERLLQAFGEAPANGFFFFSARGGRIHFPCWGGRRAPSAFEANRAAGGRV